MKQVLSCRWMQRELYNRVRVSARVASVPARICLIACLLTLALCSGCGRSPIQGKVTFDGKPVEEGTISFEPADGNGASAGGKIIGGRYELKGDAIPSSGKKTVRIFAMRKNGRRLNDPMTGEVEEAVPYIPDIYNYRSTLTCEVAGSVSKPADFHLKPH